MVDVISDESSFKSTRREFVIILDEKYKQNRDVSLSRLKIYRYSLVFELKSSIE